MIRQSTGVNYHEKAGAGAAGGLGYAFLLLNGKIQSGAELIGHACHLDQAIKHADWVITGEGRSDHQTQFGKVPYYVAQRAKVYGCNTLLLSGSLAQDQEELLEHFTTAFSIISRPLTEKEAMKQAQPLLFHQARQIARLLHACYPNSR